MIEILAAIKTAIGKAIIEEGDPAKVDEALLESRRVFNEVLIKLLDGEKVSDKDIQSFLVDNTKQRIIAKAKETFKSFKELEEKGEAEELRIYENKPLPLRMNFGEGYNLWINDGRIWFRVTLIPRKEYVKGYLQFSKEQEEIVRKAIEEKKKAIKLRKQGIDYTPEYDVTIAELVKRKGEYYLHITITRNVPVSSIRYAAGIDVNEDNVAITVYDLTTREVVDSFIVDYAVIKFIRHYWFAIRKRLQEHGAKSKRKLGFTGKEHRQIEYLLHLVSRRVADYLSKYQGLIVFMEDLNSIRNGNKGKRMNRRLHSWPFRKLQLFLKYKLEWLGVPVKFVPPEDTSRRCPLCGVLGIRHKKLFTCPNGHKGHADRNASVNILIRGCVLYLHVPYSAFRSMKLPNFRMWKLRRDECGVWGCVNQPLPAGVESHTAAQRQEAEKLRFQQEEAASFSLR
ncbi:transposase, IS605 OrfB family, central region [Archaeoglobus sulfaticallidus PM70-1]|uniref:Transposase, IS605 OrfB family, central region n=1 Tax=Archaeoglobus sulfaticallidus PM70-1 TaxID=387631 RepID=N0BAD4_9EURY|nr:RNA-guided endonuclease TnpB family protein [Archaeoglobus sulfaticallidus]AGK60549.1 transposase, IS605 OrfB family, central region [Archaeoglobus sulfaticallidus PM70-1]